MRNAHVVVNFYGVLATLTKAKYDPILSPIDGGDGYMDTDTWVRGGITSEEENVFFSHVYLKLLVSLVLMVSLSYIYVYLYDKYNKYI